ncbi:DUF2306 domain-containing protein [Streptomyces albulus]|nr:DUF2306 domain-containing protein [Streptomyces noursei]
MNRPRGATWRRTATIAVVVVCVGYAPIAMTDLWPYAQRGAPDLGTWLLGRAVSPQYVADALATRIGPYGHSLAAMILHSVLGGLLMLLGPVQLLSAIRRRIRLHRALGVVFALTVYASMAGAAVYLARTAPGEAFSGPAFWIVLATILVGTVLSVTFGILAAVGGLPDLHQRWMLLCYGYLMTAPLLRLEWGALPVLLPGLSMEDVNRVAIMHLGSVVVFGSLLASRAMDKRDAVPGVRGTWVPTPVLVAAHVVGAAGLVRIVASSAGGAPPDTACSPPIWSRSSRRISSWSSASGGRAGTAGVGRVRSGGCTWSHCAWPPSSRPPRACSSNATWGWTGTRHWPPGSPSAAGCWRSRRPPWSVCGSCSPARCASGNDRPSPPGGPGSVPGGMSRPTNPPGRTARPASRPWDARAGPAGGAATTAGKRCGDDSRETEHA